MAARRQKSNAVMVVYILVRCTRCHHGQKADELGSAYICAQMLYWLCIMFWQLSMRLIAPHSYGFEAIPLEYGMRAAGTPVAAIPLSTAE